MCAIGQYNHEGSLREHTIKCTIATIDGQCTLGIVPRNTDSGKFTLFIIIVSTFILVKGELGISPWIDTKRHLLIHLIGCGLTVFANRQNATSLDKHRNGSQSDRSIDECTTCVMLTSSIIIPTCRVLGQIGSPLTDIGFCDGMHQQCSTKHIFILLLKCFCIICKVENERTHQHATIQRHFCGMRIDVW